MKKMISLLVFFAVFATTAFAQINFDQSTERHKNHRGSEKPRKNKHRKR